MNREDELRRIHALPDRYEVNAAPVSMPEEDRYPTAIKLVYRGNQQWAITRGGMCLDTDGTWDYEPSYSNREDGWLSRHRFTFEDGLDRARKVALELWQARNWVQEVLNMDKEEQE